MGIAHHAQIVDDNPLDGPLDRAFLLGDVDRDNFNAHRSFAT